MLLVKNNLKELVKEKYSAIALQTDDAACYDTGCCGDTTNLMADDYTSMVGYNPDADLGLGCGLPTQFAKIKKGCIVIPSGKTGGCNGEWIE